jgi:hypothetical protein
MELMVAEAHVDVAPGQTVDVVEANGWLNEA